MKYVQFFVMYYIGLVLVFSTMFLPIILLSLASRPANPFGF